MQTFYALLGKAAPNACFANVSETSSSCMKYEMRMIILRLKNISRQDLRQLSTRGDPRDVHFLTVPEGLD